ncbi:CHAP domain-containing protein [Enterococcus sp. LJL128]|uniref:CHAP domain-containing protein n=1 Tax=Enterococcus sp. LJL51 TaxID=3416656 RepID=UPI003CEA4FBF
MVKASSVATYVNSLVGQRIDMDNAYGSQCMDLTIHVMKKYFDWWPSGNAIHLTTQAIPAGFQRIRVTNAASIKKGDVLIWGLGIYAQYGHTAIAVEDGQGDGTFVSVDQNWHNSSLEFGSPAARVLHNMDGVWGVIRPNYETESAPSPSESLFDTPCFFEVEGDSTTYYFDGKGITGIAHPDEKGILNTIYKANYGKDMPTVHRAVGWFSRLRSVSTRPLVK